MLRLQQAPGRQSAAFPARPPLVPEQAQVGLLPMVAQRQALPQALLLVPEQAQVQPPAELSVGSQEQSLEVISELARTQPPAVLLVQSPVLALVAQTV